MYILYGVLSWKRLNLLTVRIYIVMTDLEKVPMLNI